MEQEKEVVRDVSEVEKLCEEVEKVVESQEVQRVLVTVEDIYKELSNS